VTGWHDADADVLADIRAWANATAAVMGESAVRLEEAAMNVAKAYQDPNRDLGDELRRAMRAERAFHVFVVIAVSRFGRPAARHVDEALEVLETDDPTAADWDRAAAWAREHFDRRWVT